MKTKIAICSHAHDTVPFDVHANHLHVFSVWAKEYDVIFIGIAGLKNAEARNLLVTKAIEKECTHVLFIDVDHILDENLLPCLLSHEGAAMVSGLICKRGYPYPQVGFVKADDGFYRPINIAPEDKKAYHVDVCAFGCTLINLGWLSKLETPYFRDAFDTAGDKAFNKRSDIIICERLKEIGGAILIDSRSHVGHILKPQVVYPSNRDTITMNDSYLYNQNETNEQQFQLPVYEKALSLYKENNYVSVVDIGCGDGNKLKQFFGLVCEAIEGIDNDLESLEKARLRLPKARILEAELDDKDTDYADWTPDSLFICADVLEHLDKPGTLLQNIPKGSLCVFSTPDDSTVPSNVRKNSGHTWFWDEETFQKLLTNNGYLITEFSTYKELMNYTGMIAVCQKL